MPLDLEPGHDEQTVLDALIRLFDREGGIALARRAETARSGVSRQLWETLAESGFVGLGIAEQAGGGGASVPVTLQASRAAGRSLAPVPLESAGFLIPALVQRDRDLCAAMTTGRLLATAQISSLSTRAGHDGQIVVRNGRASGRTGPVPYGAAADAVLLRAGDGIIVVDLRESGSATPVQDMAARGLAIIELADAPVLATLPAPSGAALTTFRVLLAARAVGGAEACLRMAVEYARERQQFGRPIGAFQAIQHSLADASIAVSAALLLVQRAASITISAGAALAAWLAGTRAFVDVSQVAVHVFGGYGFTLEYDPQLFYRSAKALETMLGPVRGISHDEARELVAGFDQQSL
jgi:alkylation response protein AidB-like acyl-CoA dehydrogenase